MEWIGGWLNRGGKGKCCAGITTVAGGTLGIVAGMTGTGRTGGDGIDVGVCSYFLGIHTGLASMASRSGVLALASVVAENSSVRSFLALAAGRLVFFKAVFVS